MKSSCFFGKGSKFLISALVLFFLLIFVQYAYVQPPPPPPPPPLTPYTTSAHGSANGVNRTGLSTFGYSVGNCAHCHEQHAMIGGSEPGPADGTPSPYLLFTENFTNQSENFCLYCHKGAGSLQVSFDRTNYNYSYWFGGDHTNQTSPNNIRDAFNPASYGCCNASRHNLQDILDFVKTKWPATFGNESNPCNACHNPHLSQRGYPVVRPLPSQRNNIWGDEPNEKMSYYASLHGGQYFAPYWYNSTSTYEPDGSPNGSNSNVPDYVTFCSDCHNATDTISTTTPITSAGARSDCGSATFPCAPRDLNKIDWASQSRTHGVPGDFHGSITRCFNVDGTLSGQWRTCGDIHENFFRTHPHSPDYYTDECEKQSVGELYQREPACAANTTDIDNDCNATNGLIPDGIPDNIECGSCYCTSKATGERVPEPRWWGDIKPPYETANYTNFILNCTDCHEPHGSNRQYLLRTTVNGHYNMDCAGGAGNPCSWEEEFCRSCHHHRNSTEQTYIPEFDQWLPANGGHCGNFGSCLNCHFHNADNQPCYSCSYCNAGGRGHQF